MNVTHLAWDIMIGLGTLLMLLSLWWWVTWIFRRDMPQSRWFLRAAASAGILSVVTLEAGWTVSEVGRQPWIVYQKMKVDDAATANTGIWITFVGVAILYVGLGDHHDPGAADDEPTVPPRRGRSARPTSPTAPSDEPDRPGQGAGRMSTAAAVILFAAVTVYAVFGGADFGAGFWDLIAGGAQRGERPREVIDHSIAPVWEANHVWLIFVFVLLWTCFPEAYASIMLTLFVPLTLAALGIVLRGASFAFRKAVIRTRDQRNFGAAFALSSVLVPYCLGAVAGAIASGRVPAGGVAGDPWSSWVNPTSILGGVLAVCPDGVPRRLLPGLRRRPARRRRTWSTYFRVRAWAAGIVAGLVALVGIFVLHHDATLPLRRTQVPRPAPGDPAPPSAASAPSS